MGTYNEKTKPYFAWKISERHRQLKKQAVEYKGGKCERCGYNRCVNALTFHHVNPDEKEFTISGGSRSWKRMKRELDKCIMLCHNCHAEFHAKENAKKIEGQEIEARKIVEERAVADKVTLNCPTCDREFSVWASHVKSLNVYCSRKCVAAAKQKIEWPANVELHKLLWEEPIVKAAKILGVSDVAIKKRCKKLGIDLPPKGYWARSEHRNKLGRSSIGS